MTESLKVLDGKLWKIEKIILILFGVSIVVLLFSAVFEAFSAFLFLTWYFASLCFGLSSGLCITGIQLNIYREALGKASK